MADLEVGLHRAHFAHSQISFYCHFDGKLTICSYDHMRLVCIFLSFNHNSMLQQRRYLGNDLGLKISLLSKAYVNFKLPLRIKEKCIQNIC